MHIVCMSVDVCERLGVPRSLVIRCTQIVDKCSISWPICIHVHVCVQLRERERGRKRARASEREHAHAATKGTSCP
jgi:hypothetical protein